MRPHLLPLITLVLASAVVILSPYIWSATPPTQEKKTIADRLQEYGAQARARMKPFFDRAHIAYPPTQLILVGLKAERVLQVYAASGANSAIFLRSYPILAASGGPGPKLREGDRQVPEGKYQIESLNPNSAYHLSLRIGYPNSFDRAQASQEGRTKLGEDIMIHGKAVSIGCLAMGDEAAEDLFVLAADAGLQKIHVILSPVDFRTGASVPKTVQLPDWTEALYGQIRSELMALPSAKAR